jgi:4-hydroxybenzoate polyprenyltransferase
MNIVRKLHSFTKVEHTVFSLPLLFAGAWLAVDGWPPLSSLLWIVLAGVGARTFGMAMNRILDRRMDAENPRTKGRELPSGALRVGQAIAVAVAGLLVYLAGCGLLGPLVFKLAWVPLIPLSLYSLLKRFTPLCHYGIGICLAAAPMGAFVAVSNHLHFSREILLLALFTGCWMSGFDVIYALMDRAFDLAHGVKSLPAALGERGALLVAGLTHLVAIAALYMLVEGGWSMAAFGIAVAAFVAGHWPTLPVAVRFFPIAAIAGIAGAFVVLLRGL